MKRLIIFYFLLYLYHSCFGVDLLYGQEVSQKGLVKFLASWGERGNEPGQFKEPQGISVDPSGFLYVADTGNHRIQKLDPIGRFVAEIGGFGWGKEQFDEPVALSARNGLDVFVADYYNQRIERYDKDLHYLASFRPSEDWPEHLRFGFPRCVDISSQGELFCLDGENQRILKLDVLGNPQLSFGDFDAGEGRLVAPHRLIVSGQKKVYVSDEEEGRIVAFDIHGNFLNALGEGILERPMGMAEITPDFLLVVDVGKRRVSVFRESGEFVGSFGSREEMGFAFEEPVDVAFWRNRVYVLDRKRSVVDIFEWTTKNGTSPK